ncbi:MAG: hypothetical protein US67_C0007G0015 [Candidatus Woesebacteria bacterium GW2011_GWD1_38_10]|uniref:Uncharacterized protein n=2 Tax=Candidatus Woeseibacteriota TaxID=1752722 RepID=A0A0G0KZG9_9BACT|nr:MAG: hypothetical protein US67_C0007G0015 [Candidatus Woesebacteria bacterium GW2011_GWD1_38_10]KKQ84107.1 MAG: hypothetical protein UT06_C0010G0013 [Candidatus Woesebacteria bacterium GW2011_GWA1_38_8]
MNKSFGKFILSKAEVLRILDFTPPVFLKIAPSGQWSLHTRRVNKLHTSCIIAAQKYDLLKWIFILKKFFQLECVF